MKMIKKKKKHHTQESQESSPIPAGDHKAAKNLQERINNKKDPQKALPWKVGKIFLLISDEDQDK